MYKKAGIVVALILIAIAIAVYFIASSAINASKEPQDLNNVAQTTVATTKAVRTETAVVAPSTTTVATVGAVDTTVSQTQGTQPVEVEPVEQAPEVEGTIVLTPVSRLTNDYTDSEDIGTVVGRNMYVKGNQVVFSILVNTTTHGQIEYYCDLYDYNIADGTRVTCQLRTYHAGGASFTAIISIKA